MALNLIKLCVGADSVEDLTDWIEMRQRERRARGEPAEQIHTTRMTPKRGAEILDGGSLYWVIKGVVLCRQPIVDLRAVTDAEGIGRCQIVMEPQVVLTHPQPRRAFQGWRYLEPKDAPRDLAPARAGEAALPPELSRELSALGLL